MKSSSIAEIDTPFQLLSYQPTAFVCVFFVVKLLTPIHCVRNILESCIGVMLNWVGHVYEQNTTKTKFFTTITVSL
jgi:hypothetical protein